MNAPEEKRRIFAWALYDWGNSAFAVAVMAGFFPIFFRDYWSAGQASADITFNLGLANSVASLLIVLLAPVLGAMADRGGLKRRYLAIFAGLGVLATAALGLVGQGEHLWAMGLYLLAVLGFMGGNVFYDALLVDVTRPERYDRVSAWGYGLGYLGGGLVFALAVFMSLNPAALGFEDGAAAGLASFLLVALWWALFTPPVLLAVPEVRGGTVHGGRDVVRAGLRQLRQTLKDVRALRHVWLFLLAYWLYIDGVDTIVRMAVDYGRALGFGRNELITALLLTQFVSFPAAIGFGYLSHFIGIRRTISLGLVVYILVTVWAAMMSASWEFYALALVIGLVQGGVQALSRAYYARLIPADKAAEFFGFYNMLGKFAAVIGPLMVGMVGLWADNPRIGLLSILVLFIAGLWLLWRLPAPVRE